MNMVMLGAFVGATELVKHDTLRRVIADKMGKKRELLEINLSVTEEGYRIGSEYRRREIPA